MEGKGELLGFGSFLWYLCVWLGVRISFRFGFGKVNGLLMFGEDVGRRNLGRRLGFGYMRCRCFRVG